MVFNPPPNEPNDGDDDEHGALIRVEILLVAICSGLLSFFSALICIGFTFKFMFPGTQLYVGFKFLKMNH